MRSLRELTEMVLHSNEEAAQAAAISDMWNYYISCTETPLSRLTDDGGVYTPEGIAISPFRAASCMEDPVRTGVFIRAVYKAVLQAMKDFPGERINILYAGCGPYATLVTPLTTIFKSDDLAIYLMDINAESLALAEKLYTNTGIEGYIAGVVQADAASYTLPAAKTMHLVISETMQNALRREPQVAIMLNLIPQMADKTIFIPEEIRVSIKLLNAETNAKPVIAGNFSPECIDLGTLYTIGRYNYEAPQPLRVLMPLKMGAFHFLNYFTDITVFGDEQLLPYQSGLTLPVSIGDIKEKASNDTLFTYKTGTVPEFQHEWLGFVATQKYYSLG